MTDQTAQHPATPDAGLEARYRVEKINDPNGKHDHCRYFVLDPAHDLIARQALAFYRNHAARFGYGPLAGDLTAWLDALDPAETPFPAAPETDVSALTEAERAILEPWFVGDLDEGWPGDDSGLIAAVGRIVAERLRVVEGERAAAQAEVDVLRRGHQKVVRFGALDRARAESAEAALDALRAGIEALVADAVHADFTMHPETEDDVVLAVRAIDLVHLLPGDGR